MKEIWKLLELLNEWSKTTIKWKCNWVEVYDENWLYFLNLFDRDMTMEVEEIISKKIGFIKYLVDNDKIDIEKVIDTAKSSVIDTYYYEEGIDDIYIPLLMVLAVEDEPIEYLLSVIK